MLKSTKVLICMLVLLVALGGCQRAHDPVAPATGLDPLMSNHVAVAAIESATLHLYVTSDNSIDVTVHRITSDWDELAVTWNTFGDAFDATVWATQNMSVFGWTTIDITSLVQAWEAGTYPNYGLLLDQAAGTTRQYYASSDFATAADHPFVVLCLSGGNCDTIWFDKDTYINQNEPNTNFGDNALLSTGNVYNNREKQTLIWFPIETTPGKAAIGDYVWYDANMDGIQDESEMGAEGVKVYLYNCQDVLLDSMETDASGLYLFSDLEPGDYYVQFVLPADYQFSPQDQGSDDARDSDADAMTGKTACTTLDAGETDRTWDAGIFKPQQEGCTRTIGYWKTHAGFGPQTDVVTTLLPVWLGTEDGANSLEVTTAAMAVDILKMKTYGAPSNGITKLYAQLLGAKLSIASGASDADVAQVIAEADAFLAAHGYADWSSLSGEDKAMVMQWQSTLDDYNNGYIGPGHCEDASDIEMNAAQ